MFTNIFRQEFIGWLKRPTTYFFGATFFGFAFLMFGGSAGLFDPHYKGEELKEHLNSAYSINYILQYLGKLLFILLPAIVGASIYRDFKYRVHSVLFTYPIDKVSYLFARISASFSIVIMISLGVVLAMALAEVLPGLDPAKMGPFLWKSYATSFLIYTLPNLILVGSIVVAVVLTSRNIYAAFAASLLPFLFQSIFENAFSGNDIMVALTDPFGQNTLLYYTKDWSILERNELNLPLAEIILYNRGATLLVSAGLLLLSIYFFKLHEQPSLSFSHNRKGQHKNVGSVKKVNFDLRDVKLATSRFQQLKKLWHLSSKAFLYILKSPAFIVIALLAIIAMVFAVIRVTQSGDMILLPLTRVILTVPAAFYTIICMMLIFIYTGLLIKREKNARVNQLIDTTPTPFAVLWGSKLLAMIKTELLMMLLFMIAGIIIQTVQGYYHYELGLYCYHLFFFILIPLIIWTAAAFFVHTMLDNLYLGLFVLLFGWVGLEGLPQIGIKSALLRFNNLRPVSYSDMNGYGISDMGYFLTEAYWFCFAGLLIIFSHLLWPYGVKSSASERVSKMKGRIRRLLVFMSLLFTLSMFFSGSKIYSGENEKLNLSSGSMRKLLNAFQEKFKQFEKIPSCKIRSLEARIELFPLEQRFEAVGSYQIENPWNVPLDTLLIKTGFDEVSGFDLSVAYEEVTKDDFMKFHVIKLKKPLEKGEKITMNFTIQNIPNSLFERNSSVLENGTFIKSDIFPRLGYPFAKEPHHPSDSLSRLYHYQGVDSDLVDMSLTIGTTIQQHAIGPGDLVQQWQENDRNYFKYETTDPIKFSFGINSGRFNYSAYDVGMHRLEVYSHHIGNVSTLKASVESTLTFQNRYFSDYSYPNVRIIEFPESEGSYSTAFANNLPMSEIRFVSNPDPTKKKTNLSFYVPAHELIHHWWGSTLIPARAKGAAMLTESITEYLTLQVYGAYYGKEQADNFLKLQHKRYWHGHNRETRKEPPLCLVEVPQQYISYGKGTIVLNAMSHLIGRERFLEILSEFLHLYRANHPPYPTSMDFIQYLRDATPDSVHAFIEDQLTSVSYFDNKVELVEVQEVENAGYMVSTDILSKKWNIDTASKEPKEIAPDDWVQVGFYDEAMKLASIKWVPLKRDHNLAAFTLPERPYKVVLDPNLLLLEKDRSNNETIIPK